MYEWTHEELVKNFDEMLDMSTPYYELCGAVFFPSDILKTCDPVMYNQCLNDHINYMLETDEIFQHSNGRYYTEPELEDTP